MQRLYSKMKAKGEHWRWRGSHLLTLFGLCCVCVLLANLAGQAAAQSEHPVVLSLTADGPVTPAMVEYLRRGIRAAEQRGAILLIFQLDTPGGSIDLMNSMVQAIRTSDVPVVVYVAPRGAMAGSAGTVITLAAHAAAMAPETTIGAASPVGSQGEDLGQTLQAKEKNILKATVRSLAERRKPEAIRLAEATIESAMAVSASEALQAGLVDFIANDLDDLLQQLDGFQVETSSGEHTLQTADADLQVYSPTFIEKLLGILTNPNVVFLLITIGVQAILIELSSPGGWLAGTIGVVCLALAFFGLGVLDVNWFGAVFMVVAFVLFILDIKAPTHGGLTAAGVIAFIVGALVLFNSPSLPAFQPRVSIPLVIVMSLITGAVFFGAVFFALRARTIPIRTGRESLVGRSGRAVDDLTPDRLGLVQVASEEWSAELASGEEIIPRGARVQVVEVDGLRLVVRKLEDRFSQGEIDDFDRD
jgi:membrane-bound serine protease (ClpP class)